MEITDLKNRIIEKIQKINDENVLKSIDRLIEIKRVGEETLQLNDKAREAIIEAENQIKNGEYLTDEQAKKDIRSFLFNSNNKSSFSVNKSS